MRKIKVAFFADVLVRNYDGCLRTVFHIIDRIPRDKFEIHFFCGMEPHKDFPYPVHIIPTLTLPMNKSYKMALPFLAKAKTDRILDSIQPDILHITSPSPLGNYAINYGKKRDIPVSTIYHTHFISYMDYYFRHMPALIPWARKTVAKLSKNVYEQCNKVFVPTNEMIDELSNEGIRTDNMLLWPRGINKQVFNPLKSDKAQLKAYTGNDNFNILFASRLVWEKNLKTLINIYKQIEKEKLPYNMIIAGDGVAANELKNKMPKAYFKGNMPQEELAVLYASADAFVFPSISETYGNVVIEAMACGLPCVIANGGGSKSFIDHGNNGFLCEPNKASDYIKFITMINDDLELLQKVRLNAFKFVRNLDWDSLVENYFDELKELYASENARKRIIAA